MLKTWFKRLTAKKYTSDEVKVILEKLHADNMARFNAITDKALAESSQIHEKFAKRLKQYEVKPFEFSTVKAPPYNGNYPMLHKAKAMQDAANAIDPYVKFC
jgi:hypothetical protein